MTLHDIFGFAARFANLHLKVRKCALVPLFAEFGEEVERFSPNIMFQTDATKDEIQEAIDEEVMSDF